MIEYLKKDWIRYFGDVLLFVSSFVLYLVASWVVGLVCQITLVAYIYERICAGWLVHSQRELIDTQNEYIGVKERSYNSLYHLATTYHKQLNEKRGYRVNAHDEGY